MSDPVCQQNLDLGLLERNALPVLPFFAPLSNDPGRTCLHAGFLEQYGERHTRPNAATRKPMSVLGRRSGSGSECSRRAGWSAVGIALEKMNPGHGRQALQLFQSEN